MVSDRRHIRALAIGLALLGVLLASADPAAAASGSISDARDTKGALDVASVGYKLGGGNTITHTIRFHSPVASRSLKSPQLVAFAFDTNNDKRADRVGLVLWADRALRTVLLDTNGNVRSMTRALRPNTRTIVSTFPGRALGDGYRWLLLTESKDKARCRRGCDDTVPNRAPALFDFTAPAIELAVPDPYNASSTAFNVHVKAADRGFSGVRSWTLELRQPGQSEWSTIASGASAADVDVPSTGSQGATYEARLTAIDKQGNKSSTTRVFSVPIDDASPLLAGAFGGHWDAYVNPGYNLFMSTAHRAGSLDSTFNYTFTGTYVAWLSGLGCCHQASVSIDGGLPQIVAVNNSRKPFERSGLPQGRHTITITVAPGSIPGFEIDGIVTR